MANIASFIILCLFFYGRSLRFKNARRHAQVMTFVILADIVLVGALVVGKDALTKVNAEMSLPLMIHVPIAVTTVLVYFVAFVSGWKLLHGNEGARKYMRTSDRILVPMRVLTFVTSVWVQVNALS